MCLIIREKLTPSHHQEEHFKEIWQDISTEKGVAECPWPAKTDLRQSMTVSVGRGEWVLHPIK